MVGALSYAAGLAAEDQVLGTYLAAGHRLCRRRWRGKGGEIDLILRDRTGRGLIFVEVKCSATHARAAERLGQHQLRRILAAASEYLAGEPAGQDTEMRLDLALVDGVGRIEILENAALN